MYLCSLLFFCFIYSDVLHNSLDFSSLFFFSCHSHCTMYNEKNFPTQSAFEMKIFQLWILFSCKKKKKKNNSTVKYQQRSHKQICFTRNACVTFVWKIFLILRKIKNKRLHSVNTLYNLVFIYISISPEMTSVWDVSR